MAENRAKKSGLGADIERKLEMRYDQEEQAGTTEAVQKWINGVLAGGDECSIPTCSRTDLHKHLRDGIVLCKLANKLLESEGKAAKKFQKKVASPFVAFGNIETYNKACEEYGLAKEFLVQSADLWEGRKGPFLNVINNIHSLGFVANSKGFQPMYTGEQQPNIDFD